MLSFGLVLMIQVLLFLFLMVLSMGKALSIQAHPDKELARRLHKLHPDVYKDGNHKPEMALAMTDFEALCGFITLEELKDVIHNVPEVVNLVGDANADLVLQTSDQTDEEKVKPVLQAVFTRLMSASKEIVTEAVNRLINRLQLESEVRLLTEKELLVLRLENQYPSTYTGLRIAAFFLNHVKLNPGEALFLGANEPHTHIPLQHRFLAKRTILIKQTILTKKQIFQKVPAEYRRCIGC